MYLKSRSMTFLWVRSLTDTDNGTSLRNAADASFGAIAEAALRCHSATWEVCMLPIRNAERNTMILQVKNYAERYYQSRTLIVE